MRGFMPVIFLAESTYLPSCLVAGEYFRGGLAIVVHDWIHESVDRYFLPVRFEEADARNNVTSTVCDLICFLGVLVRIVVEIKLANERKDARCLGLQTFTLNRAVFNSLPQVFMLEVKNTSHTEHILNRGLHSLILHKAAYSELWVRMEVLTPNPRTIRKDLGIARSFGSTPIFSEVVMGYLSLRDLSMRLRLPSTDSIWDHHSILDEEGRGVVSNIALVALLNVELDGTATDILGLVCRYTDSKDWREVQKDWSLAGEIPKCTRGSRKWRIQHSLMPYFVLTRDLQSIIRVRLLDTKTACYPSALILHIFRISREICDLLGLFRSQGTLRSHKSFGKNLRSDSIFAHAFLKYKELGQRLDNF
ncbi:uncharacterized protein BDR25DRAFT_350308 [Lindgomyces ingoldianus]|uniref:Uncharacterized protein n=1 Tax=Lindgomyces ingoldianus TaxID=673940 RepID=A0ACB6RA24_9PLEO|nr:uncharacterized protein BDR25DRAFT_350308 [Lindgomyces ingoldianus]KAF2476041.1 hypothetical protein BDR25DRAFT_350308 [Lindgomyces ingoldianus]